MTTISSTYANPASTSLQDYSGIQLDRATDQDGDDKSASIEAAHHHHRGGGHMHDAVRQALSSLGLSASAAA
ncbi:MAG TPA: hypothetical protein VFM48_11870, partial [Aquabacterium sp.]|nr:hypothetical protein [Aquabacterium sp.]